MIFFPVQCRMARAALGDWAFGSSPAAAKVSVDTVARFERGEELKDRRCPRRATAVPLRRPASSLQMAISPASVSRRPLQRTRYSRPARQNRRLRRKQSTARPPRRPRKNDRSGSLPNRALGDPCAWFARASNSAGVEFIDGERRWTGVRLRKRQQEKGSSGG